MTHCLPAITGPLGKDGLRLIIKRMAEEAGVEVAYPHKFRHAFAISFLYGGGGVFPLQAMLGHATLDTVKHYSHRVDGCSADWEAGSGDHWLDAKEALGIRSNAY